MFKSISEFSNILKYCFKISFESSKKYTWMRIAIKLIIPLVSTSTALLMKYILDIVVSKNSDTQLLLLILVSIAVLMIISAIADRISQYISRIHSDIITNYINKIIISISGKADIELFDNPEYYDKLLMVKRDSNSIVSLTWSFFDVLSSIVTITLSLVILLRINYIYGMLILLASIPIAIVSQIYTKQIYDLNINQLPYEREKQYYSFLLSEKNFSQEVRLFNNANYLANKYAQIWQKLFCERKSAEKKKTIITSIFSILPVIVILFISVLLINSILNGLKTIGDYTLCMTLINQLSASVMAIISQIMLIYEQNLKVDNIINFSKLTSKVKNDGLNQIAKIDEIFFDNIYFKYPNAPNYILEGFTLKITGKEKIAILGENGAGKSTIIKLLLRFYDLEKGVIYINGVNIKEYELMSLRKCFSIYFQNSLNYSFSLEDNVVLGDKSKEHTEQDVVTSLTNGGAKRILEKARNNLKIKITKMFDVNGLELSYGEHQKLALARTIFRKSSVMILDEPSSSLDQCSENELIDSVSKEFSDNILIVISHKDSILKLVNRVVVISHGQVVSDERSTNT